ncbi:SRPBCC family protein [Leifsonia sp. C5G2]|uniref:SRPBCC family protein n=1 Tax=Leifsonia sp. C5G2 TaxID=2735269 RepID=UPI0015852BD0|nr:SRPBCC family protein [Leifsonia sp. C5G2]NUU07987.1 SRPBCC family protein [Leifsonia sp. C5G2]
MRTITDTIDISAPPHEVYVALRTLDGYPGWLRHSIVYLGTRAADGSGAYVDSTTVGRMRGALTGEDPDRSLRFHQAKPSGGVDASIRYDLAAVDGRTRVVRVGELTTRGVFRAMQPVLVRMAAAESRRTMRALKAHAERPA